MDRNSIWLAGAMKKRREQIQCELLEVNKTYTLAMEGFRRELYDLDLEQEYGRATTN